MKMNKKVLLKIVGYVILTLLLINMTFTITYLMIPYSYKDADRVCDIVLERTKPTPLDYLRLDVNNDKKINMQDCIIIVKKVEK